MMQFDTVDYCTAIASNSLKPVRIVRNVTNDYDRNEWMVYTPDGRLLDECTQSGPFNSFNDAQRDAEAHVGMSIKELKLQYK